MKQDYFTRDKGKYIPHKRVGSEVRLTQAGKFNKALKEAKK